MVRRLRVDILKAHLILLQYHHPLELELELELELAEAV